MSCIGGDLREDFSSVFCENIFYFVSGVVLECSGDDEFLIREFLGIYCFFRPLDLEIYFVEIFPQLFGVWRQEVLVKTLGDFWPDAFEGFEG